MKDNPLSFKTAKTLRSRVEILPPGPKWKAQTIRVENFPTKVPMTLYYRDPLDCLQLLFSNPLFAGHIDFCPRRVYQSAEKLVRVYSEWMTGDSAWEMQVRMPINLNELK